MMATCLKFTLCDNAYVSESGNETTEHAHECEHVLGLVEAIKSRKDESDITRLYCLNLVMSSCVRVIDGGVSNHR